MQLKSALAKANILLTLANPQVNLWQPGWSKFLINLEYDVTHESGRLNKSIKFLLCPFCLPFAKAGEF